MQLARHLSFRCKSLSLTQRIAKWSGDEAGNGGGHDSSACSSLTSFNDGRPTDLGHLAPVHYVHNAFTAAYREAKRPTSDPLLSHPAAQAAGFEAQARRLNVRKERRYVPQRLNEPANDGGAQMSGYLSRRVRRSWKRNWFVLKDRVLYIYKASEDVVALDTIPVLGYTVQVPSEVIQFDSI